MKRDLCKMEQGFSLIELMISILLGLILMVGVMSLFTSNVTSSNAMLASARLNQDLSSVMTLMVNDIRRAGFGSGNADFYGQNANAVITNAINADINLATSGSGASAAVCVLFSYDRFPCDNPATTSTVEQCNGTNLPVTPASSVLQSTEYGGFRLQDGVISTRISCTPNNPADAADACFTSCNATNQDNWEALTDSSVVTVTAMTLTTTGSKCVNLRDPDDATQTAGSTYDKDLDYWEVTSTSATNFPCNAAAATGMTYHDYNQTALTYSVNNGAWSAPQAGEIALENRQVNITLTAELKSDSTVTKTLSSTANVRSPRLWRF